MTRDEIINSIRRNGHKKTKAIILISDFLAITKSEATKIYEEEFEHVRPKRKGRQRKTKIAPCAN